MAPVAVLAALLLAACMPLTVGFPQAASPTLPPPTATGTSTPAPTAPPTATVAPSPEPAPPITRVMIVSMDGLRPEAIDQAPMPALQALMQAGAYSLSAQTISPTTTLPAHASMLSGLCPAAHGVSWDEYLPEKGYAAGTDLFDLAHAAGLRTVMVVGKEKLRQVTQPESLDVFQWVNDPDTVVAKRAAGLIPQGFSVLFVHLPDGDLEGHAYGWLSTAQLLALRNTDQALKVLLDALQAADMLNNTLVIVTADHGGHNTSHGFDIPADLTIPWIASGPGIRASSLRSPINTTDTAATAAWALGLPLPAEWSGHPVLEAFGRNDPAERQEPRCP